MRRVIVAGMLGNGLEWYDFALYGQFAPILGKIFFPGTDAYTHLIEAYGIFAVGFLSRPLGAIFFGYIGDRFGRKTALSLSILLMAVPTAAIGLLPTYASIGIAAPVMLVIIRLLQGLSLAGQYSGSITFIVEHAPPGRRGLAGSMTVVSLCAGILLGAGAATLTAELLSPANLESWGWRIPFLLGVVIAGVAVYIPKHTSESPSYEKAKAEGTLSTSPVRETFKHHFGKLMRGIGIYLCVTVPFYTLSVFMTGFLSNVMGHSIKDALLVTTISMVVLMFLVAPMAALTDKYGRKRILMATTVIYFFAAYPLFRMITAPDFSTVLTGQLIFTLIVSFYIGAAPTVFVELFPTSVRYTGMSLSYNICAAVFGGTTPMVETFLVQHTGGIKTMPAFYIMLCAVLSFVSFIGYHDRYKEDLQ